MYNVQMYIRLFKWMYGISEILIYCCILLDTKKLHLKVILKPIRFVWHPVLHILKNYLFGKGVNFKPNFIIIHLILVENKNST